MYHNLLITPYCPTLVVSDVSINVCSTLGLQSRWVPAEGPQEAELGGSGSHGRTPSRLLSQTSHGSAAAFFILTEPQHVLVEHPKVEGEGPTWPEAHSSPGSRRPVDQREPRPPGNKREMGRADAGQHPQSPPHELPPPATENVLEASGSLRCKDIAQDSEPQRPGYESPFLALLADPRKQWSHDVSTLAHNPPAPSWPQAKCKVFSTPTDLCRGLCSTHYNFQHGPPRAH